MKNAKNSDSPHQKLFLYELGMDIVFNQKNAKNLEIIIIIEPILFNHDGR